MYDPYDRVCCYPCHVCEPEIKTCICGEYYDSEEADEVEEHKECVDGRLPRESES